MSQVALWVGLFTGVAGIVLSIVAIWFSTTVDKRSRDTSVQTIQSMQKIEGFVDRISTDIGGLIRAAWDRMLGTVPGTAALAVPDQDSTKAIAAGLAAELRLELAQHDARPEASEEADAGETGKSLEPGGAAESSSEAEAEDRVTRLDRAVRRLERSIEAQLNPASRLRDPIATLETLSPLAVALLRQLAESRAHMLAREYSNLIGMNPPIRRAVLELRDAGLVVPLAGADDEPVYWIPHAALPLVGAGILTLPPDSLRTREIVKRYLEKSGYLGRVQSEKAEREAAERRSSEARTAEVTQRARELASRRRLSEGQDSAGHPSPERERPEA